MKHIHHGLAFLFLSLSSVAIAQDNVGTQNQEINTKKFCVYAGKIYSLGSLIEAGGALLECRAMPAMSELVEPGARWARSTSDVSA